MAADGQQAREDDVAALCQSLLRRQAQGDPLTDEEVARCLDLVDDERTAPADYSEPPHEGWHAAPGHDRIEVGSCARDLLKGLGGDRVAPELARRLEAVDEAAARQKILERAIDLLGPANPVLAGQLEHPAEARRLLGLAALGALYPGARELPFILSRLLDDSVAVVAAANALMRNALVPFETLPADAPGDLCARARTRLEVPPRPAPAAAPRRGPLAGVLSLLRGARPATPPQVAARPGEERAARLEAYAHIACLAADWPGLAATAKSATTDEARLMFGVPTFRAQHVGPVLAAAPELRDLIKSAAVARFAAATPGRRRSELSLISAFAPDEDVFEAGLQELRKSAHAGRALSVFVRCDAARMPRLLDAAFENRPESSFDAAGLAALFDAAPRAFASALAALPASIREPRVRALEALWRMTSHARCIGEMQTLLAELAPAPEKREKAVRRNYRPPDWTGSGKKPYS